MSKLFFDHLLDFKKLDKKINQIAETPEDRDEIWKLIDEIVHYKTLDNILDKLHPRHHTEFLELFHANPHDEELIFNYLREKIDQNIEEILRRELGDVAYELLESTKNTP